MSQPEPLTEQRLDEISARTDATRSGPWILSDDLEGDGYPGHLWVVRTPDSGPDEPDDQAVVISIGDRALGEFIAHAREDVPGLLAEVRRLRLLLPDLASRWELLANQGDAAVGHFEGPAAAILDAEVCERGRTYRKAAADVRDVLASGRIPHDLMTDAESRAGQNTAPAPPATPLAASQPSEAPVEGETATRPPTGRTGDPLPAEDFTGTQPCGHDDHHDGHPWHDRPDIWCPGIGYGDDQAQPAV